MHKQHVEAGRRKGNPLKRLVASRRREVLFEPAKKQKLARSLRLPSRLDLAEMLTSADEPLQPFRSVSPSRFYAKPKSLFEQQYERHLRKFVPLSDDFVPLESSPEADTILTDAPRSEESEAEEVFTCPEVTPELLATFFSPKNGAHATYMLRVAARFLEAAHAAVLSCNDTAGTKEYYTYVTAAIKALLYVHTKCISLLSPALELAVCHTLGSVFLRETQALDRAEKYASLAMAVAARNGLVKQTILAEYLYSQVLAVKKSPTLGPYLLEKIRQYSESGYRHAADFFKLLRISGLDVKTAILSLRVLGSDSGTFPGVKVLAFLSEANFLLQQGSHQEAHGCLESAKLVAFLAQLPVQFDAAIQLAQLLVFVQANNVAEGVLLSKALSSLISKQRKAGWPGWNEDGRIPLDFPLAGSETLPVQVHWLNSDDFVIMFYFYSAMLQFLDSYKKSHKVFKSCLSIIDKQLHELTDTQSRARKFAIQELTLKIVRLNFIRFSVILYNIWLAFMHNNDTSGLPTLRSFLECFENENFTKEESLHYRPLIPKFLYLAALMFHAKGDLNSAKYYFLRVRLMASTSHENLQRQLEVNMQPTVTQNSNELYLFSTLHLLILTEFEVESIQKQADSAAKKQRLLDHHSLSSILQQDLVTSLESLDMSGNHLFQLSHASLVACIQNKGFSHLGTLNSSQLAKIVQTSSAQNIPDFFKCLSAYITTRLSSDPVQKVESEKILETSIALPTSNNQIFGILQNQEVSGFLMAPDLLERYQRALNQVCMSVMP